MLVWCSDSDCCSCGDGRSRIHDAVLDQRLADADQLQKHIGIHEECGIPRDFQLSVSSARMQTMLMVQNLDFLYIIKESFGEEIFEGWRPEGDVEVRSVHRRL